jgi:hypothetical protein
MVCNESRNQASRRNLVSFLIVSFLTLSGCSRTTEAYPTPIPPDVLPTAIQQTAEALNATARASQPTPTVTPTATITPIPTITQTPTPIPPAPVARLHILSPGPASLLASPLQMRLFIIPSETNLVQVALFSEDERLLARDLFSVNDNPPPGLELTVELPFQIRLAQIGRLEVLVKDKQGRIEALTSEHLTLLPVGLSQLNPPDPAFERAVFYSPQPRESAYGGSLLVEGAFWPINDQPVILQLEDEAGMTWTRQLTLKGDTFVTFNTSVPFNVSSPTLARLSIRQADTDFNAVAYLYSILVMLNP